MIEYMYLMSLIFSLSGLVYADFKHKLVFFGRPALPVWIMPASIGFFLVWDITGIALGVFATNQAYVSGLYIVSANLPIEEFLFLALLTYTTLIARRFVR